MTTQAAYCVLSNVVLMLMHMAREQPASAQATPEFQIHHRMALAMEVAGLDREKLAEELGVHRNTVTNWVKGHTPPSRAVLIAFAFRCGVPFNWLLTGERTYDNGPDSGPGQVTDMSVWKMRRQPPAVTELLEATG